MIELVRIDYNPKSGRYCVFDMTKRHENRAFTEIKEALAFAEKIMEDDYVGAEAESEPCDT